MMIGNSAPAGICSGSRAEVVVARLCDVEDDDAAGDAAAVGQHPIGPVVRGRDRLDLPVDPRRVESSIGTVIAPVC